MTVPEDIREHHTHCVPYQVRLRILARDEASAPLPPGIVHEVSQATSAILAGAIAAERAAVAAVTGGGRGGSRVARFLAARLARLAAAADYVVTAARDGNAVALRQHLRRFDALTSALWTVLPDVCDVGSQRPCRGSSQGSPPGGLGAGGNRGRPRPYAALGTR